MEGVLANLSSFIDFEILEKLKIKSLTANSLYSEVGHGVKRNGQIVADYIRKELMKKNRTLQHRLLSITNAMSSHSLFDPIFCQLTLPFIHNYLHETLENPELIDESSEMHNLFPFSLSTYFVACWPV